MTIILLVESYIISIYNTSMEDFYESYCTGILFCKGVRNMKEEIITAICALLAAVITYVIKITVNYLKARISELKTNEAVKDKEMALLGLDTAERAIKIAAEATVGKLEEIIAKELREKIKNGEANKDELYALAGEAYNEIIATIRPELLKELSKSLQDVDLYIKNQIEQQLLLLKSKLYGGTVNE